MHKLIFGSLTVVAMLLNFSVTLAQQSDGPAEGTQDVAPAGGLSIQEGITTVPTKCPDGSAPVLKVGEEKAATSDADAIKHYVCPDGSEITVGSGVDEDDSAASTPTPTMK